MITERTWQSSLVMSGKKESRKKKKKKTQFHILCYTSHLEIFNCLFLNPPLGYLMSTWCHRNWLETIKQCPFRPSFQKSLSFGLTLSNNDIEREREIERLFTIRQGKLMTNPKSVPTGKFVKQNFFSQFSIKVKTTFQIALCGDDFQ